jgi:hypothetical protein
MKTITILAATILFSTNLFASYNGPIEVHFDSYAAMDAFPGGANQYMAKLTNNACRKLQENEGIRKIGIEFNQTTDLGFYQTSKITPVSTINVEAVVTIGNEEGIKHSIICFYESVQSELDLENNQIKIKNIDSKIRQKFFNDKAEKTWGSGFSEMYQAKDAFLAKNVTSFNLQDLPVFKRIDLDYDKANAESMMGEYPSIVLTNLAVVVKNQETGVKERIQYLDVTRVALDAAIVYDNINNREVNIQ